jgi:hypothetical protein
VTIFGTRRMAAGVRLVNAAPNAQISAAFGLVLEAVR